jgi:hypothetical protein
MTTADVPALCYSSAPGRWVLAITVLGSGIAALDAVNRPHGSKYVPPGADARQPDLYPRLDTGLREDSAQVGAGG